MNLVKRERNDSFRSRANCVGRMCWGGGSLFPTHSMPLTPQTSSDQWPGVGGKIYLLRSPTPTITSATGLMLSLCFGPVMVGRGG